MDIRPGTGKPYDTINGQANSTPTRCRRHQQSREPLDSHTPNTPQTPTQSPIRPHEPPKTGATHRNAGSKSPISCRGRTAMAAGRAPGWGGAGASGAHQRLRTGALASVHSELREPEDSGGGGGERERERAAQEPAPHGTHAICMQPQCVHSAGPAPPFWQLSTPTSLAAARPAAAHGPANSREANGCVYACMQATHDQRLT